MLSAMATAIKRTLARTSLVKRVAIRYPVIWAHHEIEVRPWDVVRGGDLGTLMDVEGTRENWPLKVWEMKGAGLPAPPSSSRFPPYYPRLTRTTPFRPIKPLPKIGAKDYACQEIAKLVKHLGNERKLKGEVLKVANKYGPLIPSKSSSWEWDTLEKWIYAAQLMDFYLSLIRSIKTHSTNADEIEEGDNEIYEYEERRKLIQPSRSGLEGLTSNFTNTGPWGDKTPIIELPLKEYREALGAYFWESFSSFTFDQATLGGPGNVSVRCGSFGWAHYELWELLNSNRHVLLCSRCHRPFVAVRNDALTCSSACEKAFQRQRNS